MSMDNPVRYRVTVYVDTACQADWLDWMVTKHIPDVMNTGYFSAYHLAEIVAESANAPQETFGYIIEYSSPDWTQFETYQETCAPALQKEHHDRYAGKVHATRHILQNSTAL